MFGTPPMDGVCMHKREYAIPAPAGVALLF